jgi:8-oxo-dGTP pyrophosphatase MutT (NUDIX family)
MMWRHRFVFDRWVWELPGGYVDPNDDAAITAAREVEEETGWRPMQVQRLLSFQPMVSTIDSENIVYWADGAEESELPRDVNEAAKVAWIPLAEIEGMIERGEIHGSTSVVALLALLRRLEKG